MADNEGNSSSAHVELRIEEIIPPDLFMEARYVEGKAILWIESHIVQESQLDIFTLDGVLVDQHRVSLQSKGQDVVWGEKLPPGMYTAMLTGSNDVTSCRIVIHD